MFLIRKHSKPSTNQWENQRLKWPCPRMADMRSLSSSGCLGKNKGDANLYITFNPLLCLKNNQVQVLAVFNSPKSPSLLRSVTFCPDAHRTKICFVRFDHRREICASA